MRATRAIGVVLVLAGMLGLAYASVAHRETVLLWAGVGVIVLGTLMVSIDSSRD